MLHIWLISFNHWFRQWRHSLLMLLFCFSCIGFISIPILVHAQGANVKQAEDQVIREFALPEIPVQPPVYQAEPTYTEPTYTEPAYTEPAYTEPLILACPNQPNYHCGNS
ncbi:MAG: hypothetical protein HC772_08705 [Leptolyngbyaceae cyanobacterium CRU_2_3]|nr:hypothetical protein [Leptolyngbyaceae cyanobacterium CRU_2_3]